MNDFIELESVTPSNRTLKELARSTGKSVSYVRKAIRKQAAKERVFGNGQYQVNVTDPFPTPDGFPEMIWLSIKRLDKKPIHDWRELQEIKSQVLGPEFEAVELYPAESRVVDVANQYHLWALRDPKLSFPFGMVGRMVRDGSGEIGADNTRQRPLSEGDHE